MPATAAVVDPRGVRYVPMALWLIAHRDEVSGTARDVYAVLASLYNDDEGGAWPRWSTMQEILSVSRSTIARAVTELEDLELILRTRRGSGRSVFYQFPYHPWMDEHPIAQVSRMTPHQVSPGDTHNDNFSQTSRGVLRTPRRAASEKPQRRSISSRADNSGLDTIDSPALGGDIIEPDDPQRAEKVQAMSDRTAEAYARPKRARQRPADPAAWTSFDLGSYFITACGKLAGEGHVEAFVGIGSAKVVATNVQTMLARGVRPEQVKDDIDYFVVHYREYAVKGAKPDKAFLAAAPVIREKTLARAKAEDGGGFTAYVHRPKGMRRASA